jgi:ABC-type sugar transport system substrate-binding protein
MTGAPSDHRSSATFRAARPRELRLFLRGAGEYQEHLRQDCADAARRHGFDLHVDSADDDASKQTLQIQNALDAARDRKPIAFLVCPVREAAIVSVAHSAARAGIGFVVLLRSSAYMAELRDEVPQVPVFNVLCDQWEIGRIQGRWFRTLLPDGGEVVYLRGPLGTSSAVRRFEGVQEILAGSPLQVFTATTEWTLEGGETAMKQWLEILENRPLPKLVIGAQNDAMAMGARTALEQLARRRTDVRVDEIPIVGCDGTPGYGRRLVDEGKLTATVIMPPVAGIAVNEIAAFGAGRPRPPAEIVLRPTPYPEPGDLGSWWQR